MSTDNTKAIENAALIQKLINGGDLESIQTEIKEVNTGKKNIKKSKSVKTGRQEKVRKTGIDIEISEVMKKLDRGITINVGFGEHDIPYKEQIWDIPRREVVHELRLCKSFKRASDIAKYMSKSKVMSEVESDNIRNGLVAYFTINTDEPVSFSRDTLGYVKCYINKDGKPITDVKLIGQYMHDNHVTRSNDKLVNDIKNKINKKILEIQDE